MTNNNKKLEEYTDEDELTVPQAAEEAGVTTDYIHKRIHNKGNVYKFTLKAKKKGRDYFILYKDLKPLLEEPPSGRRRIGKKKK